MNEYFEDDAPIFRDQSPFEQVIAVRVSEDTTEVLVDGSPPPSPGNRRRHRGIDPGNIILLQNLNPSYSEFVQTQDSSEAQSEGSSDRSQSITAHMETVPLEETANVDVPLPVVVNDATPDEANSLDQRGESDRVLDANSLKESARAAVAVTEGELEARIDTTDLASRPRVDSGQGGIPYLLPDQRPPRHNARSPLTLEIKPDVNAQSAADDTIATSPTLRKHVLPPPEGNTNTLSRLQPTSPTQDAKEKLPSFRQVASQLNKLADAAEIVGPYPVQAQQYAHHHSHSFSSTTSQSPRIPYYTGSSQTSPVSYYAQCARSPTSTTGDIQHYQSPPQFPTAAYYAERRSSAATDQTINMPPSLPSASSSADSHGHTSSSTDGYSTSHTTPIDQPQHADGTPRPVLPPLTGIPQSAIIISSGFRCDYPGCTAVPFQTQYLLSSHKNVHSQSRPHYCPVQDCPRSEGGKGFKRKNEMIRHGLVHNSPGYICPFCPDREHRYPRPDNLQRHVRVHHVDKDRDDSALREVLAQRNEGAGKARRRRTNGAGIGNPN